MKDQAQTKVIRSVEGSNFLILIIIIFIFGLALIGSCIYNVNTTHAETLNYSVTIDPSLNITLPTNTLTLDLNPVTKAFATKDLNVSVATNNSNGYKLTLTTMSGSGGTSGTELVNINDITKTIETLPIVIGTTSGSTITTYAEDTFPVNKWGYKISARNNTTISNSNYLPYISGTTIALNNSPVVDDTTTLIFASKIDYNQPSGIYAINLSFNGTINPTSPPYMQNLNPDVCVTDHPTLVVDSRDNRSYYIQRLADNKCWMIQNLRLGQDLDPVTGALVLTDQDTDISTTDAYNPRAEFVLTNQLISPGGFPTTTSEIGDIWDGPAFYCTNDYGCYYNWYTATAGSGTSSIDVRNIDVAYSICPKNWSLPNSGDNKRDDYLNTDFMKLVMAYGYGTDMLDVVTDRMLVPNPTTATENTNGASVPGFLLGGAYSTVSRYSAGSVGRYWSRTNVNGKSAMSLDLMLSSHQVQPNYAGGKYGGEAVRCLLQE